MLAATVAVVGLLIVSSFRSVSFGPIWFFRAALGLELVDGAIPTHPNMPSLWADRLKGWIILPFIEDPNGNTVVIVSGWLVTALFAAPTAFLFWRDRKICTPGHCPACNYNLTANESGACPECGTKV